MSLNTFAVRSFGGVTGLPTYLAAVLLIGVPILVIGSTGFLLYYFLKARASKQRNRAASKSSQVSNVSADADQEMALVTLVSSGATFRSVTSDGQRHSYGYVMPTDKRDRQIVAGHVKGSGSEVFDVQQYEMERANERSRNMILPSPTSSPTRPKTAPSTGRPQFALSDSDRPLNYNRPANDIPAQITPSSRPQGPGNDLPLEKVHRRSRSLGRPSPIRPPRPFQTPRQTYSPAGSVRSLSIFPPNNRLFPNSPGLSPGLSPPVSQQGHTSPSLSPSPPLLSPLPYTSTSPPARLPPPKHARNPSTERNSLMPIAPILMPSDPSLTARQVLPTVEERTTSAQGYYGYEEQPRDERYYRSGNYI
jgi:hypothetical protein